MNGPIPSAVRLSRARSRSSVTSATWIVSPIMPSPSAEPRPSGGEEDGAGVLGVEELFDRHDLAVADLEDEVVEVVVGAPVLDVGVAFGLHRDPVALGGPGQRGEPDRAAL